MAKSIDMIKIPGKLCKTRCTRGNYVFSLPPDGC